VIDSSICLQIFGKITGCVNTSPTLKTPAIQLHVIARAFLAVSWSIQP
jgi:hypothetical protein